MVKVIGCSVKQSKEGKTFVILELQGDLTMLQSSVTGQFYATVKRSTVTSTFDEETAKGFIGKQIPGRIEKVACLEYEYTVPETGEVIQLSHRWEYLPEGEPTPVRVVSPEMAV